MFSSSTAVFGSYFNLLHCETPKTTDSWVYPASFLAKFFLFIWRWTTAQVKIYVTARACFSVYITALLHCSLPNIWMLYCECQRVHVWSFTSQHATMEVPTRAELRKLKVVELRQRLVKASLPQGGEYYFVMQQFRASQWYSHWKICDQLSNDIEVQVLCSVGLSASCVCASFPLVRSEGGPHHETTEPLWKCECRQL